MKNRFCRIGNTLCGAIFLLFLSGATYSCTDNYDLDETKPEFLGGSIYDELKARKNFTYTLRLIDNLDYTDVMSKTGSKTLFVANDEAFETFFKNNPWGVESYDKLSIAQKRILFNGAQLNNAYVVEMMSNGSNGQKNLSLRQTSAAAVTDSVPFWRWDQLPKNESENKEESKYKYWQRFANEAKGGLTMAIDATVPLMTHFLEGNMRERNIKHSDVAFILNHKTPWPEDENRSYIYDARIVKEDIVCLNGYLHEVDRVILPPGNMAEEIRKTPDTRLFSQILDRFSAPFYNEQLTKTYAALYANAPDSVFEKRYFATNTRTGRISVDPDRKSINEFPLLVFDPGWNAFATSSTEAKEQNMAAMFVPNDKALTEYFLTGGGRVLMDRYATRDNTEANLSFNLDQIPLDIIQALVNNLMKPSFIETVPSKYLAITNDARDQMFPATLYGNEDAYKATIDKTLLANNGVVYVMNRVVTPADYASVIAPALYSKDAQVMRTVIRADDSYIQGNSYREAPLQQYFSTYLKAMQSRFSFFIPVDEGLKTYGYVDPASLATGNKRNFMYYSWFHQPTTLSGGKRLPIAALAYEYNAEKGQRPGTDKLRTVKFASLSNDPLESSTGTIKKNLLIDMVNQHILLHENNDTEGVRGQRMYYLSRMGAPVKVVNRGTGKGENMEVRGGFQEQLQGTGAEHNCVVKEVYDQTGGKDGYGNGMTYLIDRPMQPTTITTYKAIAGMPEASKFLELCMFKDQQILEKAGLRDSLKGGGKDPEGTEWNKVASKYFTFVQGQKPGVEAYNVPENDRLVRFFNNYRYTVYVPTDDAMEFEINQKGLKTWTAINDFLDANLEAEVELATDKSNKEEVERIKKHNDEVKAKAQAMITTLVAFIRYHFQDESIFVDNVTETENYSTSCVNEKSKVYLQLTVKRTPGNLILVDLGRKAEIPVNTNKCNIMVRDANYNNSNAPTHINSSSYAVVHQIEKALLFDPALANTYQTAWSTAKKAKAFVAKYRIKE